MSVSLTLIPIALTLRLVMGKNNFNKWVESAQIKVATDFKNDLELVRTVRKAGYDAEKWGGSIKTHIDGKNLYFFWEKVEGKWTAVFGKSDSKAKVEHFMNELNRVAGRNVFENSGENTLFVTKTNVNDDNVAIETFPTNFRDGQILFSTLKQFGVNPIYQGSKISCKVEESILIFSQTQADAPFQVQIKNAPSSSKIYEYLSNVDEDYKRCVQSMVYEKVKARVADKNMEVEHEEILEDNSIVLTINVRG